MEDTCQGSRRARIPAPVPGVVRWLRFVMMGGAAPGSSSCLASSFSSESVVSNQVNESGPD